MRFIWVLAIVLCVHWSASGQEARVWSLKECVDVALQNNLRIKRSVYNVETFKANLLQAKGAFLPSINAFASGTNNYGRAINPVTNVFVDKNSQALSPQISGSLPIFNGLRIQNTLRQNKKDVLAADADLQKAKNDLILNVVTLYTNVIFNKELFENAKFQLNSSQQTLERISKQVEAGSLSMSNQLNQEAQVATNELNMINQENALNLSILQLKQSMQVPASESLTVETPDLQLEDLILDQTAESVYQIALANMPEIQAAALKVESADMALKASRGSYYPRITLTGSTSSNYSSINDGPRYTVDNSSPVLSTNPTGMALPSGDAVYSYGPKVTQYDDKWVVRDQLNDNLFKAVSLQLNIPILNGLQTRAGVQRSIINKELAEITVKETQNTLRQSIETAYNDAVASSRSYASSLKQVNAQNEAYRMNKQRFDAGALSIIELRVSENDLFRAKSDLVRAKYNFIFKKKVLDFYQGKTIEY